MSESASPQNFFPTIGMLADISEEYLCFLRYYGKYLRPQEGEKTCLDQLEGVLVHGIAHSFGLFVTDERQ